MEKLKPNPYSPSEQMLGDGVVVQDDHRPRRRVAALSIAIVTLALLFFFVTLVQFEPLEVVFASVVWFTVCLPMAGLVNRWGMVGFLVGIPVSIILMPVAFMSTFGIALTLGIEVMPVPN